MPSAQGHTIIRRRPKNGEEGPRGYNGCVTRVHAPEGGSTTGWESGFFYRNDSDALPSDLDASGVRYIDVVLVEDSTLASGYMAYECLLSNSGQNPASLDYDASGISTGGYWRKMGNQSAVYVTTIVAKNASFNVGSAFSMTVLDDDNAVVGGMKGVSESDAVGLWYGSSTPGNAPFRVDKTGKLVASLAEITGKITAEKGKIGPFYISETDLSSETDVTISGGAYKSKLELGSDHIEFTQAVGSIYQKSVYLGVDPDAYFRYSLLTIQGGDIWHQGVVREDGNRALRFYASDIICRGLLTVRDGIHLEDGRIDGKLAFTPYVWSYVQNGWMPADLSPVIHVLGNNGDDNPCYIGTTNVMDGMVVMVVNRNTSHRVNVKNTTVGDHWIADGSAGIFVYVGDEGKWMPVKG